MHIRNLLLSTVMCGSVALVSSASWSQTAPKVTYKPQGEWAVSRMAAKGPGKEPYCTMARRFGENTILTFARNAKDETSLAMDFQPNTLAKGQSYYVTLDAGSNEKRAFDVTPVSDKAMVIRLGQDAKFHDALNESGVLNVDVAGLQFEFSLPDMAKGHQDLGGCVTSIVEPAAGSPSSKPVKMAQADTAPVARHASDNILAAPATNRNMLNAPEPVLHMDEPVANISAGISETESLREENLRLKNALERERREYEDRAQRENSGSSQVSEVMEKLKLLEKENGDLKYQLVDARSAAPKAGIVSKAEPVACIPSVVSEADPKQAAELSMLREENARLKSDIAAQKTAMVQLEMQASQAKTGVGKVSTDMTAVTRMQARVDELVAQNSKLQSDLMSAKASAATAASVSPDGSISIAQLRSVETQLKSVEAERDSLRSQIEKFGEGQEEGLLKLSGSDWNLEQATRRYNEAEREIRRLGAQLEQSRTQCSAEKKEIEYMLFDPEIATQQQISKLMTLENEVTASKEALAKKDSELAKKDGEVNSKLTEYEQKIAKLESEIGTSKASESELAALRNELAVAKQGAADQIAAAQQRAAAEIASAKQAADAQVVASRQGIAGEVAAAQQRAAAEVASAKQAADAQVMASKQSAEAQMAALQNKIQMEKANADAQLALMQNKIQTEKASVSQDLAAEIARANAEKEQLAQRVSQLEADKAKSQTTEGERLALQERISLLEKDKSLLESRLASAIQPAAGTPRAIIQEQEVAAVIAQPVEVDPIAPPGANIRPGQVSARDESAYTAPVALAPRSAIPSDTFVPTQPVVAPVVQALAPQAPVVAVPAPSVPSDNLITADALSGQLRQAGLALTGNVKKVDNVSGPGFVAYSWDASGLFGSAEQKALVNAEQFQTLVNQYLDKTKSRCTGDFAASPVPTMPTPGVQLASYEIACISPDGTGATAALAFYGKDGLFTSVAHEAGMDTMDMAMDARDRVIAGIIR